MDLCNNNLTYTLFIQNLVPAKWITRVLRSKYVLLSGWKVGSEVRYCRLESW